MPAALELLCGGAAVAVATTSSRVDEEGAPCRTLKTNPFAFRPAAFPIRPFLAPSLNPCLFNVREELIFSKAEKSSHLNPSS
jgi:hypothetical protein